MRMTAGAGRRKKATSVNAGEGAELSSTETAASSAGPTRASPLPFIDQRSDQGSPARLVRGTEARAVVAVEILVKEQEISPVRVFLELSRTAKNGTAARFIAREEAHE